MRLTTEQKNVIDTYARRLQFRNRIEVAYALEGFAKQLRGDGGRSINFNDPIWYPETLAMLRLGPDVLEAFVTNARRNQRPNRDPAAERIRKQKYNKRAAVATPDPEAGGLDSPIVATYAENDGPGTPVTNVYIQTKTTTHAFYRLGHEYQTVRSDYDFPFPNQFPCTLTEAIRYAYEFSPSNAKRIGLIRPLATPTTEYTVVTSDDQIYTTSEVENTGGLEIRKFESGKYGYYVSADPDRLRAFVPYFNNRDRIVPLTRVPTCQDDLEAVDMSSSRVAA